MAAIDDLRRLVSARERLAPAFAEADAHLSSQPEWADAWAEAALALMRVNAGAACHVAFYLATARLGDAGFAARLGAAAAALCREAGAGPARVLIEQGEALPRDTDLAPAFAALVDFAGRQPAAAEAAAALLPRVLAATGAGGYGEFLAAGLRAYGKDRARLLAYVRLEDPLAKARLADQGLSGALRRAVPAALGFADSLWGQEWSVRFAPKAQRPSLALPILVLPEAFAGRAAGDQGEIAAAALAHAAAHRAFGAGRFDPRRLKPVQVALTSLVEDARVELLAMRRFPGLRRLWAPFHDVTPDTARTVPDLMRRMSRALFDPAYEDGEPWIAKARALFAERLPRIDDAAIAREIGNLLGNDLGQMRLSFNAKSYVVEPCYRDDHAGLWTSEQPPDAEASEIDVAVEAMRRTEQEVEDGKRREDQAPGEKPAGRARSVAAGDETVVIGRLPEWDYALSKARQDWVTVKSCRVHPGRPRPLERERAAARVQALIRGARLGLPKRLKRQAEGDQLDIDAAIAGAIERRSGRMPDERVFQRVSRQARDMATLLLVDASQSTSDPAGGSDGLRIIDREIEAASVLAAAIDGLGDRLAIEGFASAGREDVRLMPVKDFDDAFDALAEARLAGLAPGLSTRLGAALRQAGRRLAEQRAWRRVAIVITDGEPFDVDCDDARYLTEDARHAVQELRAQGIDAFALGMNGATASGVRIFGRGGFIPVARAEALTAALAGLYFRLSAR
ncbi:nitric oxide reductase activation protein NorD [Zavarzinia sp.]|uniref:nitric oxide reductase activation protein NorD n=1 Tax=Zavarzinia sp. TaxID=2027920 RepID=UPI00356556BC